SGLHPGADDIAQIVVHNITAYCSKTCGYDCPRVRNTGQGPAALGQGRTRSLHSGMILFDAAAPVSVGESTCSFGQNGVCPKTVNNDCCFCLALIITSPSRRKAEGKEESSMRKRTDRKPALVVFIAFIVAIACDPCGVGFASAQTLTVGLWLVPQGNIISDELIVEFEALHPGVKVELINGPS